MFALYQDLLKDIEQVTFLPTNLDDVPPWFVDVLVPDPVGLREHLAEQGIGSRPFYPAIHSQPAYGLSGHYPNSEYVANHGLWLPSSSFLDDEAIKQICGGIWDFYS